MESGLPHLVWVLGVDELKYSIAKHVAVLLDDLGEKIFCRDDTDAVVVALAKRIPKSFDITHVLERGLRPDQVGLCELVIAAAWRRRRRRRR